MKTFLKEAWFAFVAFGISAIFFALAIAITIYRAINGRELHLDRVILYLSMCGFLIYQGYKGWQIQRIKRAEKAKIQTHETDT